MRRPDVIAPSRPAGQEGAEKAEQREISEANGRTHGRAAVKRLIVGAAVRGLLPARVATRLLNVLRLRGV